MHGTFFIQSPPLLGNQYRDDAVAVVSECMEAFGGAGYVEDAGLPTLLRDAQVPPIWQGTPNVIEHVFPWLSQNDESRRLQANARRRALTLGRALELSLPIEHAACCAGTGADAATHTAAAPVDLLADINSEDAARLIE